ncbi:Asp-tRNA(Asn)/Glu-tRNA(Gln) amidotransferase subunit GatB [candidate division KSB1 bacterium]|nr:Asp-tRNA(Asn)/Glu-tRNA(Gln) amidotransferase subunit GatB [candidate division KSB1 bacterium]
MKFEPVIGLEVHAQLATNSKIFCGCSTQFGAEPNTQTCPVCLGLPGVLPVLNEKVVEYAVRMGLAVNCEIREKSILARKNYFYPDLPKGYQISQYEEPICEHGRVDIQLENGEMKRIRLTRIHIEEDAGKSIHDEAFVGKNESLVDVNRCGTPLIEIVSEPDMHSPQEAYQYLTKIRQMVRWLGICDGNMEEGSLRCDANISLRPEGTTGLGVKTELKNMNTFRGVEKALAYEIERQNEVLQSGGEIVQQTLLWDEAAETAHSMRSKEEAHDYRYFPDPDLLPVIVEKEWKQSIADSLPELPDVRRTRWLSNYDIPVYDVDLLNSDKGLSDYTDKLFGVVNDSKTAANWVMGDVLRFINDQKIEIHDCKATPDDLAKIIQLVEKDLISRSSGKKVFEEVAHHGLDPKKAVEKLGLAQVSDSGALDQYIEDVIQNHSDEVEKYLSGKDKVFGFLMGQVMQASKGKANPGMVNQLLRKRLEELKS